MSDAERSTLRRDLAVLAAEARRRSGPPPSEEELAALADGRLDAAAAERLRDDLAVHPAWARAYVELVRLRRGEAGGDAAVAAETGGETREEAVDEVGRARAWARLEAALGEERSRSGDPVPPSVAAPPAVRRGLPGWAPLAALAALVVLSLGVWMGRGESAHQVALPSTVTRGAVVEVPRSAERVEWRVSLEGRGLDGEYDLVLRTPSGDIAAVRRTLDPGQAVASLTTPTRDLRDGSTYRLSARPAARGAPAGEVELASFRLRFVDE